MNNSFQTSYSKNKLHIILYALSLVIYCSCSSGDKCGDVNLGALQQVDEGDEILRLKTIKSVIYLDQEFNQVLLPFVGNSFNEYPKIIPFECRGEESFHTLNYMVNEERIGFNIDWDEAYFRIIEKVDLPLVNSLELAPGAPGSDLLKQFANHVQLYVFNDTGSTVKLSLYTYSVNPDLPLKESNVLFNKQYEFYESIEIGGKEYFNVHRSKDDDFEDSEVFFSREMGLIQFTDIHDRRLTLDSIIFH